MTKHALPVRASSWSGPSIGSESVGAMRAANSVLEQGGAVSAGSAGKPRQAVLAAVGLSATGGVVAAQDDRARQVREWLLLLLRFAITRDPEDHLAVLMMANGIDRLGRPWGRSAPSFFRRSSHEVCDAITALDDPRREAILEGHMARISHPRLRQAFQAAVHPERRTLEDSSPGKAA